MFNNDLGRAVMLSYWAITATVFTVVFLAMYAHKADTSKEFERLYEQALCRKAADDKDFHQRGFGEGFREGQDSMALRFAGLDDQYQAAKARADRWQDECLRLRREIDELWGVRR